MVTVVNRLAMLMCILLVSAAAEAQQVCYSYDSAGRLIGVIDENRNAALYQYDAVGNITSIRRASPTGPITVYAVFPLAGKPGEQVEVFGVGLGVTPADNQVTVGGVAAPVTGTLPCTVVMTVPADGITGTVRVTTPLGEGTSEESFLVSRFAIASTAAAVLPNIMVQFSVVSNGCNDPAVIWSVNGVEGGTAATGTITNSGLYTSPPAIPTPAFVTIRAQSVVCPTLFDDEAINIVTSATTYVYAAASATHGFPPPVLPSQAVFAQASVKFGTPEPALPPGTVLSSASAGTGPVITSATPNTRARGPNGFLMVITGINLTGATGLTFFGPSAPDPLVTASNVTVNANGTISATVVVPPTAALGPRTIRVDTPSGNSTAVRTSANTFTVTQ
jgi:YD repeat-containing protein